MTEQEGSTGTFYGGKSETKVGEKASVLCKQSQINHSEQNRLWAPHPSQELRRSTARARRVARNKGASEPLSWTRGGTSNSAPKRSNVDRSTSQGLRRSSTRTRQVARRRSASAPLAPSVSPATDTTPHQRHDSAFNADGTRLKSVTSNSSSEPRQREPTTIKKCSRQKTNPRQEMTK